VLFVVMVSTIIFCLLEALSDSKFYLKTQIKLYSIALVHFSFCILFSIKSAFVFFFLFFLFFLLTYNVKKLTTHFGALTCSLCIGYTRY